MKTALGYIRVSMARQANDGLSLDVQRKAIRDYAELRGLDLIGIIEDPGESTVHPLANRPGGAELVRALDDGCAQHVIGYKLCRVFRGVVDCRINVDAWDASGIALHLVDLGGQTLDTSTPMGKFALTVLAAAAEMERGKIRENVTAALAHKKAKGERTGRIPYGYRLAENGRHSGRGNGLLEKCPDEQRVLSRIKGMRSRGWSVRRIAQRLNDSGAVKRGGRWTKTSVHRMVQREAA